MAASTRDLFIFTILDDIEENNFRELPNKPKPTFKLNLTGGKDPSSFYPALNYMPDITSLKTLIKRKNAAKGCKATGKRH